MKRFSPTIIGVFVVGALAFAIIGVIAFGGQFWWRDREYIAIYFDDSVHGLERGSSVRLMGVRVGRVSSINVRYSESGAVVQVVCELDRSPVIVRGEDAGGDLRDRATLEQMVADGLQARLDLIGITGMLFIELDFFGADPARQLAFEHPQYVVVPSVPTALAGITDNLAEIARELGTIDFSGIAESAIRLLETANRTLENARVAELMNQLHDAVANVNEFVESRELQRVMASAGQSFEDIGRLAQRLEAQVEPLTQDFAATSEELRQTLREAGQTFSALQDVVGPRMGLGEQLQETMIMIESAARSVERLADYLERNPQAILRGRDER